MEQSGTDRRVRKTKSQLRLALMELLVEKSAKNISVRELAERKGEMLSWADFFRLS